MLPQVVTSRHTKLMLKKLLLSYFIVAPPFHMIVRVKLNQLFITMYIKNKTQFSNLWT